MSLMYMIAAPQACLLHVVFQLERAPVCCVYSSHRHCSHSMSDMLYRYYFRWHCALFLLLAFLYSRYSFCLFAFQLLVARIPCPSTCYGVASPSVLEFPLAAVAFGVCDLVPATRPCLLSLELWRGNQSCFRCRLGALADLSGF
jgi:hypothetical protein